MKIGEKRRKNFPLVRLFMVCMTIPAIPKPIRSRLRISVDLRWCDIEDGEDDGTVFGTIRHYCCM